MKDPYEVLGVPHGADVGGVRPSSIRMVVVLPAPLRPSRP